MTEAEKRSLLKPNERIDDLQRNHLEIIQAEKGFRFGMDAVLLSAYAKGSRGDCVLDLGTGTGIIPILMSARTEAAHFTAVEIQPEYADRARRSIALNGLQDRIEVVEGDLREADAWFAPASFDVVTSNPPYLAVSQGRISPDDVRACARHELQCNFEDVARVTQRLLRPGGHCYLVHRPQRLAELMTKLCSHRLEPKHLRLVFPYADRRPNLVLMDCVRDGRSGVVVESPLVLYREDGSWTEELREIYES